MATKRGENGQLVSLLLLFLGAVLLCSAATFNYLSSHGLDQIPLNIDQEMRLESISSAGVKDSEAGEFSAKVLNMCSLSGRISAVIDARISSQQHLFSVQPGGPNEVTYQMNSIYIANAVRNAQGEIRLNVSSGDLSQITCVDGVLRGSVDLVTVSRTTGLPVLGDQNSSSISFDPTRAAREIPDRQGFQYYLPPHLKENGEYQYFDSITEQSTALKYVDSEVIHGRKTFHFFQDVPTRDLSELELTDIDLTGRKVSSPPPLSILVKPSSWWRIRDRHLTPLQNKALQMHRFATVTRDLWVDQESGVIIQQKEYLKEEYRLRKNSPLTVPNLRKYSLTVYEATLVSDNDSVIAAVNLAKDYSRKIVSGKKLIPNIFKIVGIGVLGSGIALLIREITWRRRVDAYISRVNFESSHQPVDL